MLNSDDLACRLRDLDTKFREGADRLDRIEWKMRVDIHPLMMVLAGLVRLAFVVGFALLVQRLW